MSDTVLDVLLYLFETYTEQEPEAADQDVLRDELLRAGFGEPEVDSALDWLDGLNETSAPYAGIPGERSVRVYNEVEIRRLDLDCRGYLLYLEQVGILSAAQREVVIDRLMALGSDTVDKEQLKWVVLMVLFAQPGQETAFSRMEDLVFAESADAMLTEVAVSMATVQPDATPTSTDTPKSRRPWPRALSPTTGWSDMLAGPAWPMRNTRRPGRSASVVVAMT